MDVSQMALPFDGGLESLLGGVESFHVDSGWIERQIVLRSGLTSRSLLCEAKELANGQVDAGVAEAIYLQSNVGSRDAINSGKQLRCVDLFSGCGGLSIGVREAARALGLDFVPALAVDFEREATAVYSKNFPSALTMTTDISKIFDGTVGGSITSTEADVLAQVGSVNLLVGGPPCQGHSDLNNKTRRLDPKNALYFTMVRATEVLEPEHVLIENVPGAINDKERVVQRTAAELNRLGYEVDFDVIDLSQIGVPQRRKRLVLLASTVRRPIVAEIQKRYATCRRSVAWAIADLVVQETDDPFDCPAKSAPTTRERIRFLFENDLFDLPDSERPPCHREKVHSYKSIYGRIKWDEPAQTITRGFYSMCMGRYVHPAEQRTLTSHEAARLQYFPDSFDFSAVTKRGVLAELIGNAVPSKLSYTATLELFR